MKSKFTLILFFVSVILIASSFVMRESYEKEMYKSYLKKHKESLIESSNKEWKQWLVANWSQLKDPAFFNLTVGKDGKYQFYPQHSKVRASWKGFSSLSLSEKKSFLMNLLDKKGSWDRARAVTKWQELYGEVPTIALDSYEQTLVSSEAKLAFDLIFEQIKKGVSFEGESFADRVLMFKKANGAIDLVVPRLGHLKEKVLPKFSGGHLLTDHPFELHFNEGGDLLMRNPLWEKLQLVIGIILLLASVAFYLWELRGRKLEALKKVSFLNQLVHEVKTPITGIKLNADILQKYGHDQKIMEALLKSAHRLHEFFDDIVLINRNDQKMHLTTLDQTQWNNYIDDFVSEFGKKITFDNQVEGEVTLDRVRVRIIVRNLLKNALRYGGGGHCEIRCIDQEIVFRVTDKGPGIPSHESKKIFGEFFRGKNASPDGLGIGLSIVKNLSQQMDATVELENPGQKNATFVLRLK